MTRFPRLFPADALRRWDLLALAAAIVIATAIASTYLPLVVDDALISFRYSDRLLAGSGLTFTDGERVEGYSNFLWVLTVAAGALVVGDLILAARAAGILSAALTLAALFRMYRWNHGQSLVPLAAGLAFVALSHSMGIWAIAGLEQPLLVALLAWSFACLLREDVPERTRPIVGLLLAGIVLTRPDGALIVALLAFGMLLSDGLSKATLRELAVVLALPVAAWVGQLAFRISYYGDWLPNTAYVKVSWSVQHTIDGLRYVWDASLRHAPLFVLSAIGVLTARPFRRRGVILPAAVAVGWAAYVVSIGGDIFPGRRHFLPIAVSAAFLVSASWRTSVLGKMPRAAQVAVLVLSAAIFLGLQHRDPENLRAREEMWEWDCAKLASTLRAAFAAQQPLVAADPIGCIGYFSKLPALDMMGLNDRHIARTRPPDFGQGFLGHELGDGRYVLAREPDLLLFCSPAGSATGCFRSGVELVELQEFRERYLLVNVAPPEAPYLSRVWVRTDSPRIGVTESPDGIRIPGFLFASGRATAVLSADNRLVTRIPPRAVVQFTRLSRFGEPRVATAVASRPVTASVGYSVVTVTGGSEEAELIEVVLTR